MKNEYMTVEEAAKYLNRTKRHICWLCVKGKLQGAEKFGEKVWAIPRKSIEEYEPSKQGFAAVKARKEAEKTTWAAMINAAIREAVAKKQNTDFALA